MSTISESTELPTASESEGSLLPSTVTTRSALRAARASALEVEAKQNPDWAQKFRQIKRRKHKPPKDSRIYKAAMSYIALKAQGLKGPDIAKELGLEPTTLRQYVHMANQRGWFNVNTFADPEDKLEIVLASKAVRNINTVLDETEPMECDEDGTPLSDETKPSDRAVQMTLEVAKGLGYLKQHQVSKSTNETNVGVALQVDVQMPVNPATGVLTVPEVRPGSVGGTPYFDAEGEVVSGDEK